VFSTHLESQVGKTIAVSELVTHASQAARPWIAIGGSVYDMTEFIHLHPGGEALAAYLGMDATRAYERVEHHAFPEIDSHLAMYRIGSMRRLSLGKAWGVRVGSSGLEVVGTTDAFRAWVRLLYLAVEIGNSLRADCRVREIQTSGVSPPGALTPLTIQYVIEVHERFLGTVLGELLGSRLANLWELTIGLCAPSEDARELSASLNPTRQAVEPHVAPGRLTRLYSRLETAVGSPRELASLDTECRRIAEADAALLDEVIELLRSGVQTFERWEAAVAARGGDALVTGLRTLPATLKRYLHRLE
jgi:sulfite reductase (NADPH) flavoprotein alpha-component